MIGVLAEKVHPFEIEFRIIDVPTDRESGGVIGSTCPSRKWTSVLFQNVIRSQCQHGIFVN
jgi:hypothetical protein